MEDQGDHPQDAYELVRILHNLFIFIVSHVSVTGVVLLLLTKIGINC